MIHGRADAVPEVFHSFYKKNFLLLGTLLYGFAYDNLPYWIIHSISFIALITVTLTFFNNRVIEESKADVIKVSKEIDISNDLHENANI